MTFTLDISMILDIVIVVMLCVAIFYAVRISMFMKVFRDGRRDMRILINELSQQILRAQEAIQGLQNSASTSGAHLQEIVNKAQFLSDELRFMNESGDSLANRLEKIATHNRELIDLLEETGGIQDPIKTAIAHAEQSLMSTTLTSEKSKIEMLNDEFTPTSVGTEEEEEEETGLFFIKDREFENRDDMPHEEDHNVPHTPKLHSEAEREFYNALQRKKNERAA